MKISILLPYKENFSPSYPGAVSLFVYETSIISKFKKNITVFGSTSLKKKFSITPFTDKSLQMILVILALYLVFNFWDFSLPIEESYMFKIPMLPVVYIILKSILIIISYFFIVRKLKISNEITAIIKRFYK